MPFQAGKMMFSRMDIGDSMTDRSGWKIHGISTMSRQIRKLHNPEDGDALFHRECRPDVGCATLVGLRGSNL